MRSRPETLVILTPAFPGSEADTNWIPSHQLLVKALQDNFPGLNIIILTFFYPDHITTYTWNGMRVTAFDGVHRRKWKHLFFWRDIWRELATIRRQNTVIGLFSFWSGETALIGSYFGKFHSIRHRCWISGHDAQKENNWVKFMRPQAEELVAMSAFLRDTFYKNHGIKPHCIIPNAIDSKLFPSEMPLQRDIDILGAGSLLPLKQYHLFVQTVASLKLQFPAIKAILCGAGGEMAELQSLVKKLGLEDNLCLLGAKPHPEVLALMQRTKVFLHPSAYEGFSTVCLEALFAGAHVISFCDPVDQPVPQWHIVKDTEEMTKKAIETLKQPFTAYRSTLLYSMDDIAKSVMALFKHAD